jgi:hypothetical protein
MRSAVSTARATRIRTVKSEWFMTLVITVLAVTQASCGEDRYERYRTYGELVVAGAGPRSWFPECVPETALDLENFHNLDSNETVGTFRVPPSSSLAHGCFTAQKFVEPRLDPPLSQWPRCLRGRVTADVVARCGMIAYRDSRFIIVFNPRDGGTYYWSHSS